MTLLAFHGFEGYDNPVDQEAASDLINFSGSQEGSAYVDYTTGRNGGKAIRHTGNVFGMGMDILFNNITEEAIIGFAFYGKYPPTNTYLVHMAYEYGSSNYLNILNTTNGKLAITLMGLDSLGTASFSYDEDTWYYIELKFRTHDTLGLGIVRINEQEIFNVSGVDTHYGFNPTEVAYIRLSFPKATDVRFDDFYLADNQGTENNDFLGDIRVDQIRPNGAGNYTQLTPSVGNNYECVDDVTLDEANYVEGANAGEKDSYTYGSVPTDLDDAAIIGLQIKSNSQRTAEATNIKIDPFIRTGAADYSQTALDLGDSVKMANGDIILDDPSDSNPWTQAKINACEFGMEVGS